MPLGWQLCQCFRSDLAAQLAACVESARLLHTTAEFCSELSSPFALGPLSRSVSSVFTFRFLCIV